MQAPENVEKQSPTWNIRTATMADRTILSELIASSARGLSREDYSDRQIESAIALIFGVDSDLIADGTYFVIEENGEAIGCGGWSKRKTLFGGDQYADRETTYLDPATELAKIRAFFIHPEHARRGLGRALLAHCENEARAAGFAGTELMSTMPGLKLYRVSGYEETAMIRHRLNDGTELELVPMHKRFTT